MTEYRTSTEYFLSIDDAHFRWSSYLGAAPHSIGQTRIFLTGGVEIISNLEYKKFIECFMNFVEHNNKNIIKKYED